ncbi:hypothetical protein [Kitasatospora sp. McL0602]
MNWPAESSRGRLKERLTRIEDENRRLVELLTALDPAQLRPLQL